VVQVLDQFVHGGAVHHGLLIALQSACLPDVADGLVYPNLLDDVDRIDGVGHARVELIISLLVLAPEEWRRAEARRPDNPAGLIEGGVALLGLIFQIIFIHGGTFHAYSERRSSSRKTNRQAQA
jgi:hypothetical protein